MEPDYLNHLVRQTKVFANALQTRKADLHAEAAAWPVTGVDLSYWQGAVNFARLSTLVKFAFLRAGYGNDYIDPRLPEYVSGCRTYNIPFGLYWYAKPGRNWRLHAESFKNVVTRFPGQLYPVFDIEENGGLTKA